MLFLLLLLLYPERLGRVCSERSAQQGRKNTHAFFSPAEEAA